MRVDIVSVAVVIVTLQSGAAQEPLALARTIDLPRVEGRIDHLAFDGATGRLYVAALGNNTVEVLDVRAGAHVKSVPGFREPQGIAVVHRGAMKVIATWPLVSAKSNFPMALDEANHRLFVGCRRPAKLLVYDTTNGKEITSVDIVGDTDDLFYDAARKRLYISGGDGYIDVFQNQDDNRLARVAHLSTAAGARTSLFVPDQGRLYLAVPHRGSQKAEIRVYEAR